MKEKLRNISYLAILCLFSFTAVNSRTLRSKKSKEVNVNAYKSNVAANLSWQDIESKYQNAVAQLFVQSAEFNWKEPYRSPDQKQGAGTGFFIDQEGHLLTNFHVVNQAKSIHVFIPALGKHIMNADIVGVFPEIDVALLKLSEQSLKLVKEKLGKMPYVALGDSDKLFSTSPVLAMGYPLGQRSLKCNDGSLAGRQFLDGFSFFHITAAINPGNSGGPLFNQSGEVVGINSAGIREAQNVGYAIPINNIKIFLKNLKSQKLVRKPRLGILTNPTTEEHAKALKNPWPCGVYINNVVEGANAHIAGIQPGDMLYSVNGHKIDEYGDLESTWGSFGKVALEEFLSRMPIGSNMTIKVYRNGKSINFNFKYNQTDSYNLRQVYPEYEVEAKDYEFLGGLCVMQLRSNHFNVLPNTYTLQGYQTLESLNKEVLVATHILPGSIAQRGECLRVGQIIEEVNGIKVKNVQEFRNAIKNNLKTGILAIKTEDKVSTVISLDKILKEEQELSYNFGYNITSFTQRLMENLKK